MGIRLTAGLGGAALLLALMGLALPAPVMAQAGASGGEWRTYGGDLGSTRYSPLDQINDTNFDKLTLAWQFKTDNLGPSPDFNFQATPLMVSGVLYATAGTRRAVIALNAASGELLWMHSEDEGTARRKDQTHFGANEESRTGVLERRQRRSDRLRHTRLSPDRARR